jgi:eukaryotic-like serine/threonine-protein kinase
VTVGNLVPPVGTVPYTFVAPIAQGGMGYVELCFRREGRFLRWCARKRLHEQFRSDARFRSMFLDEARLAGLVRHPNVVGVSDVGDDEDGPFLIMDYVEGVSLSQAIRQATGAERSVPMQVAVRVCLEVGRGLHAAHEVRSEEGTVLHLVHRDVSPQNILIGFDGSVRVTDFGIAKALGNASQTNTGVLKGNMGYLSPEQLRFEEPDRRSDFFSLGVTLYELLSGARLYPNRDGFDGTRRILSEPPPDIGEVRSDVPPGLVELLFEMLSKEREARPANALEIVGRLEGILAPLIAEEGSVTVADYMDQHFAERRREQREFLSECLRRTEAQAISTSQPGLVAVPMLPAGLPSAAPPPRRRVRVGWAWLGAVAVATAVALAALQGSSRQIARTQAAAVETGPAVAFPVPQHPQPIADVSPRAPLGGDVAPALLGGDNRGSAEVAPPAKKHHVVKHRARAASRGHGQPKGPTFTKEPDDHGHLAVPLFTQWR